MPIKSCTLPEGGSGFQWGDSGHCYPTREEAEKQAAAAHANGYVGDDFNESDHPRDEEGKFTSASHAASHLIKNKPKGARVWTAGPLKRELQNPEYSKLNPYEVRHELKNLQDKEDFVRRSQVTEKYVESPEDFELSDEDREEIQRLEKEEIERKQKLEAEFQRYDKLVDEPAQHLGSWIESKGFKFRKSGGDFSSRYFYLDDPEDNTFTIRIADHPQATEFVRGKETVRGGWTPEGMNDAAEYSIDPQTGDVEGAKRYIEERMKNIHAQDSGMALDSSARTIDTDGRMHIDRSHISKAAVNPYYGFEIPNAEMFGLDPQKIYYLLRSPEELAKGAETFARLPILKKHIPVSADSPRQDLVVGAIGSEVTFLDPYLDADVCIWDAQAIAGIETETVREFSCAYHYVPLMTPGEYNGEPYDGIMTQIRGNHLALVESGRAGSDVLAADQKMKGIPMKMTKLGKALFVSLTTAFPKLAADTNLPGLLATASKKNFNKAEFRGKVLAMNAAVPGEQLDLVMDAMMDNQEDPEPTEPKKKPAEDEEEETEEEKKAREKKEKEEKEARDKKAKDEAEEGEEGEKKEREKETKAAMDSFRAELREAEEARQEVRPVVGDVLAQDSAADIYTFALDHMRVDHAGVTGVPALKALFKLANTKAAPAARVAQDSAGLVAQFPNAARFRQA